MTSRDLFIKLYDPRRVATEPYRISYAIYQKVGDTEVLVSGAEEPPVEIMVGTFYAPWIVPDNQADGEYLIRWQIYEAQNQTDPSYAVENFRIGPFQELMGDVVDTKIQALLVSLRALLRDNNPDRNYHFRPPASSNFIHSQTKHFGFIWTDEELIEYSQMAVDLINGYPPATGFTLHNFPDRARTLVLYGAAYHALIAITLNWIEEEFDYSIGGISLSIEKSSKYQGMKDNLEQLWTTGLEKYKATIKIHKGLQQPRFNPGARSLFGPYTGRNVLSIRQLVAPQRMAKP